MSAEADSATGTRSQTGRYKVHGLGEADVGAPGEGYFMKGLGLHPAS